MPGACRSREVGSQSEPWFAELVAGARGGAPPLLDNQTLPQR
jgi:hypothetical protein